MPKLDILISVRKQYVNQMLAGRKTVELRRRRVHLSPGSRVWIYSKAPTAAVEALGLVAAVVIAPPNTLWKQYRELVGITHAEFQEYFQDSQAGCAIVFDKVLRLKRSVTLNEIRGEVANFQPPQFFKRLPSGSRELTAIVARQCTGNVQT